MAIPDLTPSSQTSAIVLPATGSVDNVDDVANGNPLPLGVYTVPTTSPNPPWTQDQIDYFKKGAADQVAYVYKKLGGDILDLEVTEYQIYAAYEEACLEYSYLVNIHQGKNVLSNILGASTGSFDSDGELTGDESSLPAKTNVSLKFPKFDFAYARRVADGISEEVGMGGSLTIYSASFPLVDDKQDYDLQTIIGASTEFHKTTGTVRAIGDEKIQIKKVYWKTPSASWQYYGMIGGANIVGNFLNYGSYSNATSFHVMPAWETKLIIQDYKDRLYNRYSHHSFELRNNNLRIFPIPRGVSAKQMWFEFTVGVDAWAKEDPSDPNIGLDGVNNLNTAPFANIPYDKINSIGKQWIRRFALALSKEMLGLVRSKFSSIPIPGNDIQMNGSDLVSQGKEEQTALRDELKEILDELTYSKMIEGDAKMLESTSEVQKNIPLPIFIG
jgi:hypothetical protein